MYSFLSLLLLQFAAGQQYYNVTDLSSISRYIAPGSIVLLANGTYSGKTINIDSKGTKDKRITIKPLYPGGVILTGKSVLNVNGEYTTVANIVLRTGGTSKAIQIRGQYNRVTGFDISYNNADVEFLVGISNKNNRLDHSIFRDFSRKGVWLSLNRYTDVNDFVMIVHNIFTNRSNPKSVINGMETIRIGSSDTSLSSSKSLVMFNVFEKCNGEVEMISNKAGDVIYSRNTIRNTKGTLSLRHGNGCTVHRNFLFNQSSTGGLRVSGENHVILYNLVSNVKGDSNARAGISINNGVPDSPLTGYFQVKNLTVNSNVFINNDPDFAVGVQVKSECTLVPQDSIILNNIIYKAKVAEMFSSSDKCIGYANFTFLNNVVYASDFELSRLTAYEAEGFTFKDRTLFSEEEICQDCYGATEDVGPQWSKVEPEVSEIPETIEEYYTKILQTIYT
jgi:poly(beta-D-mannuronate) lyase